MRFVPLLPLFVSLVTPSALTAHNLNTVTWTTLPGNWKVGHFLVCVTTIICTVWNCPYSFVMVLRPCVHVSARFPPFTRDWIRRHILELLLVLLRNIYYNNCHVIPRKPNKKGTRLLSCDHKEWYRNTNLLTRLWYNLIRSKSSLSQGEREW